jgi:putative restriction endonuclease
VPDDLDYELRVVAIARVNELSRDHRDLIPVNALREGFAFRHTRVAFSTFYSGIFRPRQMRGPAALSLTTTPPKPTRDAPYDDGFDGVADAFVYHYRSPQSDSANAARAAEADNRALRAAAALKVPVIYFRGIGPGQYAAVAPAFVISDDPARRRVELQASLLIGDPALADPTWEPQSDAGGDLRRYATREALVRLHQHQFRALVLRAYTGRCAVCALREADLLQAAHILEDRDPRGVAAVVNGIALCAMHHLAYDRNLMGIDPRGTVQVSERLLREHDGPMLRSGLQGFHGATILQPRRPAERPDPERLEVRFERFLAAAA